MTGSDNVTIRKTEAKPSIWKALIWPIVAGVVILAVLFWKLPEIESAVEQDLPQPTPQTQFVSPEKGAWRFIVSGDSRNCGDVIVPAIAAHSTAAFQPSFYWHLGDLRAIYKIDEDMAYAEVKNGRYLACENYLNRAWPDFIDHQIAPFGSTPFYLGIGNHEVIPPKGYAKGSPEILKPEVNSAQFTAQFAGWLLAPAIKEQRLQDKDCDAPSAADAGAKKADATAKQECTILPRNYYHWIQGGVDFIYLDNASNIFGSKQINWFHTTLVNARKNDDVRSIVVGMHEALPGSISSDHAMCDDTKKSDQTYTDSCNDGKKVYQELLDFQSAGPKKYVYLLASHSHYYMKGIFNTKPEAERLSGWIVGTAGAVRYSLPKNPPAKPDDARTNVYGYLLGTVKPNGEIEFKFQEIKESDIPREASRRYPESLVHWCFAHNSEDLDPDAPEGTARCIAPSSTPTPAPPAKK